MKKTIFLITLLAVFALGTGPAFALPVDLELALLVDVSGSVTSSEFDLQRNGYRDAFQNAAVTNAINNGAYQRIAVTMVYWSSYNQQLQAVPWTEVTAANAYGFGTTIGNTTRPFSNNTGVGEAIAYGYQLFANNGYEGTRLVIDVSGDGSDNSGTMASNTARDLALAAGITTINGIVIGTDTSVYNHYQNQVIGGTDPFLMQVDSFNDFGDAISRKLVREIDPGNPVPEPATLSLLGMGIFGLAGLKRNKKI